VLNPWRGAVIRKNGSGRRSSDSRVGTYSLAEMPFLRDIDPWGNVGEVENLDALVDLGQRLPDANKHGSTG